MCAIFGIIGEYNPQTARSALATLAHRGPDYCGVVEQEGLFFAHQRLGIIDLASHANQPMRHENILLSFNGEIYNHKALREELACEYAFQTNSDTEVLLAAYKKWGVDFVDHLRGMFAIAILDGSTLYLFRDRLGKKPLFYHFDGKTFYFASEIKALKPFLKKISMNQEAFESYLSYLAPTPPYTFYEGIYKLAAGEYLTFSHAKIETSRYFDLLEVHPNTILDRDEAIVKLEALINEAISLRLDADVPMASLLSGGIDSATLNAYALRHNRNLQTYTLGYAEYAKYDERENAAYSAASLGVANKEVVIDQKSFIASLEPLLHTLDEPLNDPAAVPLYMLFEEIKKDGYKVVLSGEGSDELFLGYRQYFEYLDIEKAKVLMHKNWLKKYFRANFSMNREWEWYKRIFDESLLFRTSGEKFTDLQKNQLLRQNIKDGDSLRFLKSYRDRFETSAHKDESIWYSYIDLNLFQAEHFLTKLDRVSMAHSIESRTPFLDHNLACEIFKLSPHLRYEDGKTKSLLKEIASPLLDTKILTRKKKGFSNPYMEYLLASSYASLIKEVNQKTNLFNDEILNRYIETAQKGNFKQHVWGLFVLSHWIKHNLL